MEKLSKAAVEAIEYTKQNPTKSISEVGRIFNVNRRLISKYLKDNRYKQFIYESPTDLENLYHFSAEEIEAINNYDYCLEKGYPKFQEKYSGAPARKETLVRWLKILGIDPKIQKKQSYHFNRQAFSQIETEEDAYWLGFITADGCIVAENRLSINLAERDREHLVKFCRYLDFPEEEIPIIIKSSYGGAYTKDNPISYLNICSKEIVQNLEDKKIAPRKSGKEIPYICSNASLELAYIRGLIDGDGYIRTTQFGLGIVGSYEICKYVQDFITQNIKDISSNNIREHGIIYKLELTGKRQSKEILDFLYKDAKIYLTRKYTIYKEKYCRD